MSKFVAKLLGVPKVKVKRVTKLEDLLPLLQYSMADAVMVPPDKVETFRSKSALNLQVTTINAATVGRPSVSVLSAGQRQVVIDALQKVNPQVMTRMGLDVWKSYEVPREETFDDVLAGKSEGKKRARTPALIWFSPLRRSKPVVC